jgi:sulfonate transport system ATP-binding protein
MSTSAQRKSAPIVSLAPRTTNTSRHGLAIKIENLQKSFGDNAILRGIDLDIRAGEFVAIVGRSGCGKSTLLRLLLGLERQSAGTFSFFDDGKPADAHGAARIMFQEPRLLPWASVIANVEVGLGRIRNKAGSRELALATLAAVELEDKRDQWPATLSGGQKQRVSLARALVSHPRILALDEPFGALDALTRISMQRLLERVWLDQGFTALLVTHDVTEALTLADRVLVMEGGKVALDLSVNLDRPRLRGSTDIATLEGRILGDFFAETGPG